jgi:diguanylate cyclase (GGDEF)-like protein
MWSFVMVSVDSLALKAVDKENRHDLIDVAIASLSLAFVVASVHGKRVVIHFASQYFASLMLTSQDELIDKNYLTFFSPQSDALLKALLVDSITHREDQSLSLCFNRNSQPVDCLWLDVEVRHAVLNDQYYVVILHKDASEHAQACETLKRLASHDYLTSLPNRMAFHAYVGGLLEQDISSDPSLVICVIDLNRFKPINDLFGHSVGDIVLQEVGRRLLDYVDHGEMVARIGGDEFALVLTHFESKERLMRRLEAFVDVISAPYLIEQQVINSMGASFGFACYPEHGKNVSDLLHYADQQMYLQKQQSG